METLRPILYLVIGISVAVFGILDMNHNVLPWHNVAISQVPLIVFCKVIFWLVFLPLIAIIQRGK